MDSETEKDFLTEGAKPVAMKNRTLRKLKRLFWAYADIRSARELCEHLLKNFAELKSVYIRRAIEDGIMISYARPFGENEGLGSLPQAFREFADATTQRFHDRMLSARNLVTAHNNLREQSSLLSPEASEAKPDTVMIELQADGQSYWELKAPNLDESVVREIQRLCMFQEERISTEACKILREVCAGRSYDPGSYTLGDNFP